MLYLDISNIKCNTYLKIKMYKTKNMSLLVIQIQETLKSIKLTQRIHSLSINTALQAMAIMNAMNAS